MAKLKFRGKESRAVARAVHDAGGMVTRTANGHLRITGPDGSTAIICSEFGSRRAMANAVATIRLCTGLHVQV